MATAANVNSYASIGKQWFPYLQNLWDEILKDENIVRILCGSAMCFIEKILIGWIIKKKMNIIDTYYLIDYENVGSTGLFGCKNMTASDHILIFFTQNARKIDMAMIANHGAAELKMMEIPAGKQSADMHIVSYLGYLAGISNCKIVIVSKDTDFDPVIQFWKKRFGISVSRKKSIRRIPVKKQSNLQIITPASEAQIRTLFDQNFNQSPYLEKKEAIIALFLNATDKQSLNTELTKLIPGSSIPELYKVFKEFKKNLLPKK